MRLAIVGGIHGAGKSFLCEALATALDARWISAGDLLRSVHESPMGQGKRVVNVGANQEVLLDALRGALEQGSKPILLDGHFALLRQDNTPERVPLTYFKQLHPEVLMVVDTPIVEVIQRLRTRGGCAYGEEELLAMRQEEIAQAKAVSQELGVPLSILRGSEPLNAALEILKAHGW